MAHTVKYRIRQTGASKASAKQFGAIKRISSQLRHGLEKVLPTYRSKEVMFAVDSAVRNWYSRKTEEALVDNTYLYFRHLHLNPDAGFIPELVLGVIPRFTLTPENTFRLEIPPMKASAIDHPREATTISFTFAVSGGIYLKTDLGFSTEPKELELQENMEGVILETMRYPPLGNHLFLGYLSLRFKNGKEEIESSRWKPVMVVGGISDVVSRDDR